MDIHYQQQVPVHFHPRSRVWIYQSSRKFSSAESKDIEILMKEFLMGWKSHGAAVKGFAHLFFDQFIVLMADETQAMVGGCSTDSSVRLIKEIAEKMEADLFNRQNLAFLINDTIQLIPFSQLTKAWENGLVDGNTLYFNNLVVDKMALLDNWIQPVKDSWLKQKLPKSSIVS